MKLRGKIAAISSAAALAVAALALPAYATPADTNKADYWEGYDFANVDEGAYENIMCVKFEEDEESNYGEVIVPDGEDEKSYVNLFTAPGDNVYLALIVKGGNDDTGGNIIYTMPTTGVDYYGPTINDKVKDVSHWIICMGEPTGGEEESYVCGWVEGEPTMLNAKDYPNLPPWQEDGDYKGCEEPDEQKYNYCDATERPAGMSIAEWLLEGEFNGADCFDFEAVLECGSYDASITDSPEGIGPYEIRWLEGANQTPNATEGKMLPATFPEDYNGGSVMISVWVQGPEKDYLVGTSIPNYWDGTVRNFTIDTDCLPPQGGELPVTMEAELTGMCIGDTPWIKYDIEVSDPGEQLPPGAKATISFTDPNHPGDPTPWEVDFGMGYLLWPGAQIEPADGLTVGDIDPADPSTYVITNWPGWSPDGDSWTLVTPNNYGWTLAAAGVPYEISVNPTTTGMLMYPASDAAPDSNNCVPPFQETDVLSSGPPTATPSYTG